MHQLRQSSGLVRRLRLPFSYGWIMVGLASLAMTATLPGRTHGLGLITEPLLRDLQIDRTVFAQLNFWTSILGAAFCIPAGWLIDRYGVRGIATTVVAALGISVLGLCFAEGVAALFVALLLVRGFGQSALSIVSMAMIGKWFNRRLGIAMGVFSVLLTIGFIASILSVGTAVEQVGWRAAWTWLSYALFAFVPVCWLVARNSPASSGPADDSPLLTTADSAAIELSLAAALRTPAFWVFALGTSAFNLVWSTVTLFNESILAERGFDAQTAVGIMATLTGVGLLSNLVAGALATRERTGLLLGSGLTVLAAALGCFPSITTAGQLQGYAVALGLTGGIVTVVFFAAWGHLYGRTELGRIQGTAQLMTVIASAAGPVCMAECLARTGSYRIMFYLMSAGVGALAIAAFIVPLPNKGSILNPEVDPGIAPLGDATR